jgi:hypothetical protein
MVAQTLDEKMLDGPAQTFYRKAVQTLLDSDRPFLVGGAFALAAITGVKRHTKDIDIFLVRRDLEGVLDAFRAAGYETEVTYPHWLAKVRRGGYFLDVIFNLGNGAGPVDDDWLARGFDGEVLGLPVRMCAPEEMIWSKVFVLDRGRFDGADVNHLLRATADRLDWRRLLRRCDAHWPVLLSHLVLFGYTYPSERGRVPDWVMAELLGRLRADLWTTQDDLRVCRGTLFSPTEYRIDVEQWGYRDVRLPPDGDLTREQIRGWTEGVLAGK